MRSSGEGVSPTLTRPSEWAIQARACSGPSPRTARSDRVTAPWRLARRCPVGPSTSGTWAYRGSAKPSSRASRIWRGVDRKIRTPNHLAYPLRGIIDHNGELVGRSAVVAAHDEVVHLFPAAAEEPVLESYSNVPRTHP